MKEGSTYIYGAQYYWPPTPARDQWEKDLKQISRYGFNTIKVWASWNWLNPEPEKFDFSEILEMLDLAQENGLGVVINTILETAPYWLVKNKPECRYVTADGLAIDLQVFNTPSGGWPGVCLDHPYAKEKAGEFLSSLAKEVKNYPALYRWDCWNEPHMEPRSCEKNTWERNLYCYCLSSINKYQEWLKSKYQNLGNLNKVWFTRYTDWDQIEPPRNWGAYTTMMEWLNFCQWNLADQLRWRVKTIKSVDKEHMVMTHIAWHALDKGLIIGHVDDWLLAKHIDRIGISQFPKWNRVGLEDVAMNVERIMSLGKEECWISELQGGGAMRWDFLPLSLFVDEIPSPDEIARWNWLGVGMGVKGILYWQYRAELLGTEVPGFGLCNIDGSPTERMEVASRICRLLNKYPIFKEGRVEEIKVGILFNKNTNHLFWCAQKNMKQINNSTNGIYGMLYRNNISVRFININETPFEDMEKLKVIFLPIQASINIPQAKLLKQYVAQGGMLISECHLGRYSDYGFCQQRLPGSGLDEVFGCYEAKEGSPVEDIEMFVEGHFMRGREFKEVYQPTTALVIGQYEDGDVAVTRNKFGKGEAILIGSLVFSDKENESTLLSLLPDELRASLVSPCIFARSLKKREEEAIILINTRNKESVIQIKKKLREPRDIWGDKAITAYKEYCTIQLPPGDIAVILHNSGS